MDGILIRIMTKSMVPVLVSIYFSLKLAICWVVPLPSNSHHQDYYIFSRGSQPKPSFATVTGRRGTTQAICHIFRNMSIHFHITFPCIGLSVIQPSTHPFTPETCRRHSLHPALKASAIRWGKTRHAHVDPGVGWDDGICGDFVWPRYQKPGLSTKVTASWHRPGLNDNGANYII